MTRLLVNPAAECLPLARRLRRAFLIALILGLWAPVKILWEQEIGAEQDLLRYHGVTMSRELRDQLGQDLTIGVLSGMRSVVADYIWMVDLTIAWQQQEWFKMGGYVNLCTSLQPRSIIFWDIGGWQLAWNASVAAARDHTEPDPLRRYKNSQFWIQKGLDVYLRGIANNPESWKLCADTGFLYEQRLGDIEKRNGQHQAAWDAYHKAAYYYGEALKRPGCMTFYERWPAYMYEKAGDDQAAYQAWKDLWLSLTPEEKKQKQHAAEKIESSIRDLEKKLSIPNEKRVFPN